MNIKKRISLILILLFIACNPSDNRTSDDDPNTNSSNLGSNQSYILKVNPAITNPNGSFRLPLDISKFVSYSPTIITTKDDLSIDCTATNIPFNQNDCIEVKLEEDSDPIAKGSNQNWLFKTNDQRFLGVSTFYHANKILNEYKNILSLIDKTPNTQSRNQLWYKDDFSLGKNLRIVMKCDDLHTASYVSTQRMICLGGKEENPRCSPGECLADIFPYKQDPSIIYHEIGHAFTDLMMNMNNTDLLQKTDLGLRLGYDEAGAINEGISDFYSNLMTNRNSLGEWALDKAPNAGSFPSQSRPISENNSIHSARVSSDEDSRLSYPLYINYDPRKEEGSINVGVHNSGMITSHFLMSLTNELKNTCSIDNSLAKRYVFMLISETLNKLGTITSFGLEWNQLLMPGTYRSFYQSFAANTLKLISGQLCTNFTKNKMESLMDNYGLLLFKNYNDIQILDSVNESNRRISTLVTKDQVNIIDDTSEPIFYIDDDYTSIQRTLINGASIGRNFQTSTGLSDVQYNNSNGQVSPGEIIGILPNLKNFSNVDIGGVQIIANDWNHFSNDKPFIIDNFPSVSEGGFSGIVESAPVCFVQVNTNSSTQWAPQSNLKDELGLLDSQCLNPPQMSGSNFNSKECLVRVLPGGNQANYSSLSSQKTYIQSLQGSDSTKIPSLSSNNYLFFEINKNTPPGTLFNCRLRARFSNCSDCYNNGSIEYPQSDYVTHNPFKTINLQFRVMN